MSAVIEWRKWKKGGTTQYHLQPAKELLFGRRRLIKALHVHRCYLLVICLFHEVELFVLFFYLPIVLISGTTRESEEAGLNSATSNSDTPLT